MASKLLLHRRLPKLHPRLQCQNVLYFQKLSATAGRRTYVSGDPISQCTDLFLQGLHGVGLPWYFVIPTAAVLVRGVLVYYIATKPSRRIAQVRSQLIPLSLAQSQQRAILSSLGRQKPTRESRASSGLRPLKEFFRYQRTFISNSFKFGVPALSWRTPINLTVLLLFSDVIRQKCNASAGLSTILMGPFKRLFGGQEVEVAQGPYKSPEVQLADWLEKQQGILESDKAGLGLTTSGDVGVVMPSAQVQASGQSPLFEPGLASDGLPWCVDLTAADPYFILPGMLGATLFASVLIRRVKLDPSASSQMLRLDRPLNVMERISLSFGLLITIASTQWPAALLLYFIPSITVGWVQQWWLDRKLPISPPVVPNRQHAARALRTQWEAEDAQKT